MAASVASRISARRTRAGRAQGRRSSSLENPRMTVSRSEFVSFLAALGAAGAPAAALASSKPPWYPLPSPVSPKRRALVLSGGGARGAYEAGVLKWLFRDVAAGSQPFDVICGSSAGAINAAFAAMGTQSAIAQVEQLWKDMPTSNIMRLEPPVQHVVDAGHQIDLASKHGFPAKLAYLNRARILMNEAGPPADMAKLGGIVNDAGIQALVRKYPLSIEELRTSLLITATNLTKMSSDSFYRFVGPDAASSEADFLSRLAPRPRLQAQEGAPPLRPRPPLHHALTQDNFADAVVASTAIPGVFEPVAVLHAESSDANLYADGGVANNTPVGLAADAGAADITIIMVHAPDEVPVNNGTVPSYLQASFAIMQQRILQTDITLTISRNLLERNLDTSGLNPTVREYLDVLQQREWQPLSLRLIRPRAPLALSTMGFNDQDKIDEAIDQGYADAQQPYLYTMA
jgi:predicted acylesterase/phospholipase RssA